MLITSVEIRTMTEIGVRYYCDRPRPYVLERSMEEFSKFMLKKLLSVHSLMSCYKNLEYNARAVQSKSGLGSFESKF